MPRVISPERWREIERVLDAALDLPPDQRAAFIATACGTDAEMRSEVERVLHAHDQLGDFLEDPLPNAWSAPVSASAPPRSSFGSGTTIAERYVLERELGQGGMATVYLARDSKHRRPVAVKVLDADLSRVLGAGRFLREIEITANLQHPHILPLHDSGEHEGLGYYVMPYVAGESLRERLSRQHRLPVAEAVRIARDIAGALDYAHRRGVVHRDIKPGNILFEDGEAIVADFGIARAISQAASSPAAGGEHLPTRPGVVLGTPPYMSPEQFRGEQELTGRSDIYSLGCVLYEMLVGVPPFTASTTQAFLVRHLFEPVPPLRSVRPEVPLHVEQAVARALAKEPADRFETAGELADALTADSATSLGSRGRRAIEEGVGARRIALGVGGVALMAATVLLLVRREPEPFAGSAATIAVLPLIPAVPDTALARLGRELVITLSASLDGFDGMQTVDALTVLATARTSDVAPPLGETVALARRLGARSVVYGSVMRVGERARIDLVLHPTDGTEPLARVSVTAPPDDMTALTDSATWGLLRQLWQRTDPPTPSLAAITTRSMPALRAFLNGERLVVGGRWRAAADAFHQAVTLDSTFWLAYWRYASARDFNALPVDSAVRATYRAHRHEFPERDRLLIEAGMADSTSEYHERLKAITERFPDYWPGWWALSEYLAHTGPLLGTRDSDLRAALERTLALNPQMVSGSDHLAWVALWQRDTLLSGRVISKLAALGYDSTSAAESGLELLPFYRHLDALARSGGAIRDTAAAEAAVATLGGVTGPVDPHRFTMGAGHYGFPRAQEEIRPFIDRGAPPAVASAFRLGRAIAAAQRGAWGRALRTMDDVVATTSDPVWPLYRYRLAVVAAWLGAVDARMAAAQRPAVERVLGHLRPESHAELGWLDGLLGVARNDAHALAAARRSLADTDTAAARFLDRSLGAFAAALAGRRAEAADSLVAIEHERAEFGWSRWRSDSHPFLTAVNRLAAARWLAERGDAASAERLLTWHQAVLFPLRDTREANLIAEPLAYLEQARVADALGRATLARSYYERFLWRYDAPEAAHRHLVDEARAALVRIGASRAERSR
ncbi:MAG TPA: serine/threonine-protein kinase [Gemmatimonadaceae bacterium]|nr:serine/threonine-protein kinase [Gemmatimonadaceae bacterium]